MEFSLALFSHLTWQGGKVEAPVQIPGRLPGVEAGKGCAPPATDSTGQLMIMAAAFRQHRLTRGERRENGENQSNTPRARLDSMEPTAKRLTEELTTEHIIGHRKPIYGLALA